MNWPSTDLTHADDANVTTPEPKGASVLRRIRDAVRRRLEPVLNGFHEHAWSGKLYLITSGLSLLTSVAGALLFPLLLLPDRSVLAFPPLVPVFLVLALLCWVQWRVLSGVARFRPWARCVAIIVSAMGVLGGVQLLFAMADSPRVLILALAQISISIQFITYFIRERGRFQPDPAER
jgi:VIT1/CCC1 family predicted Fe2+/Mn2+ transporter